MGQPPVDLLMRIFQRETSNEKQATNFAYADSLCRPVFSAKLTIGRGVVFVAVAMDVVFFSEICEPFVERGKGK
jgi:hypothetical protein